MTIVLIEPTKKRKDLSVCLEISEARTAACPEPMPGRKLQSGAAMDAERDVLKSSFLDNLIFFRGEIVCF